MSKRPAFAISVVLAIGLGCFQPGGHEGAGTGLMRCWAVTQILTSTPKPQPRTLRPTPPAPPPARTHDQVLRVIDGDTMEVSVGGQTYRLRYTGICTPETQHPDKAVEWMGKGSAAKNEDLVGGKVVGLVKEMRM